MEGATDDNTSLRVASFSCYLDTAKENLVHKISAQDQVPIVLNSGKPTTKPPFNSNFSYSKDTKDNLTNLRVDSFSYLNTAGEKFVFNVPPPPIQDSTAGFTFPQETRKNGEFSIFGADKYFTSMKLDYQTGKGPVNLARGASNTGPRTPSLCSGASSLNSQTALLPIIQRNGSSQTKQKKAIGRRIFSGFGCQGPCFDKKGVHINELVEQKAYYGSKPTRTGSERIDHRLTENFTVKKQQQQQEVANLEESRISIEVFGSGTTLKGDVAKNMERKLSMLTWDAIPKAHNLPTSTVGSGTICDDMASDASSDLFEIENISGSIHPFLKNSAADDNMSICMSPVSNYAPSEASIQWSVVTASAADYPASDYNDDTSVSVAGDVMLRNNNASKISSKTRNGGEKEAQKGRPGGLLGCKSLKAVDVAENVSHKTNEKAKNQGLDLSVSLGKSQVTSKSRVKDIDSTLQLPRSFPSGGLYPVKNIED